MRRFIPILILVVAALASCSDDDASPTTVAASTTANSAPDSTTTSPPATSVTTTSVATASTTSTTVPTTTTTTVLTSSTTTTTVASTTTTTRPTTTTVVRTGAAPDGTITFPPALTSHAAAYDASLGDFVAYVPLEANGSDPDGDEVTYEWYSSDQGYLGSGSKLTVPLSTMGSDAAQPFITVVMTDGHGNRTEKRIQLIVWIPSE